MQSKTEDSLRSRHDVALAELEKYRLLVENIQDYAIFLLDTTGRILTWNKGAEKNKGYKPEEIIGKHFSVFYRDSDIEANKPDRELELAQRFGRVEDEDWRIRKDGTQFWANVVITALRDPSGELVAYAKVTRDLTERKMHEDALREANTTLLGQQRELQRLSSSKDEFISVASHQLRTPATSIKQYLGMLLEGYVGDIAPGQIEFIQKAYESNQHQLEIVNNLLKVAQIDAGKIVLRKAPTDAGKLVKSVVDGLGEIFKVREQKVTVMLPPSLPTLLVDISYFRMVLENLVDNASKYTPEKGNIELSMQVKKQSLEISIQDDGIGIASNDMPKLFEKFARIPNALSDSVGGTGLGLYWAYKVIALHGGRIDVQSEPGKGTTFTILMPLGLQNA